MHLQQHAHARQAGGLERRAHARHRPLDDVGAGALDRRVDRGAFGALPFVLDRCLDAREPGLAAEQGFGEAVGARFLQCLVDIDADAGEALIIAADHVLRLVRADFQPAGQAPARNAVEDREIDRLGAAARVAIDLAEQFHGRAVMNILALFERVLERGHVGHVRGQTQFDLAIVRRQDDIAGFGDEGMADLPADLGADRDILQIGIGRGQAAGLGAGQRVAGMNPAGVAVNLLLQRVGIGRFELGKLAPFQHQPANGRAFRLELLQHGDVGGVGAALALLSPFEAHFIEQHDAQLLRGSDGEGMAGEFVDFGFKAGDRLGEAARQAGQGFAVDLDALPLHAGHHRDQRPVDQLVDPRCAFGRQTARKLVPQAPGNLGILGGIGGGLVERHMGEADRLLACAGHFLEADAGVIEVDARRLVHAMAAQRLAGVEVEAHHHRIVDRCHLQPDASQDVEVIFDIMADLEHRIVGEQGLE